MSEGLNYAETTIQFDYPRREAEFYTTKKSVFESLKRRNPNYIRALELEPGFIITYPMAQVRPPRLCLKTGGAAAAAAEAAADALDADDDSGETADDIPFTDTSDE